MFVFNQNNPLRSSIRSNIYENILNLSFILTSASMSQFYMQHCSFKNLRESHCWSMQSWGELWFFRCDNLQYYHLFFNACTRNQACYNVIAIYSAGIVYISWKFTYNNMRFGLKHLNVTFVASKKCDSKIIMSWTYCVDNYKGKYAPRYNR